MNRTVIETLARKALKDMKDSPERSMRNFIDLAVLFSDGRFKDEFLCSIQELLQDENSAYYLMARDTAHHIDDESLLTFGMNIGYNSCTSGARIIRKIEKAEGFDIPWALYLEIADDLFDEHKFDYDAAIKIGKRLGIHTYLLFSDRNHEKLLPVISKNKDCAFMLLCEPETINELYLDEFVCAKNCMTAVRFNDNSDKTATACAKLRDRKMLHSTFIYYSDNDSQITEDYPWCETEQMHSVLTMAIPTQYCSETVRKTISQTVYKARMAQRYTTVPWDGYEDNSYIDSVISERACVTGFDRNGCLYTAEGCQTGDDFNLFKSDLKDILKRAFPKTATNA